MSADGYADLVRDTVAGHRYLRTALAIEARLLLGPDGDAAVLFARRVP